MLSNHILTNIKPESNADLYQALSCIFGAFYGDCLGSYVEFSRKNPNNYLKLMKGNNIFNNEPGQTTDDSEMAMSMAYAIMDTPNILSLNQNLLFFYYGFWRRTFPPDIGRTTKNALDFFLDKRCQINDEKLFDKYRSHIKALNDFSLANGFLMRISPLIVWYYYIYKNEIISTLQGNPDKDKYIKLYLHLKSECYKDCEITHPNTETGTVSALFIFMALCAMIKLTANEILEKLKYLVSLDIFNNEIEYPNENRLRMKITSIITEFSDEKFDYDNYTKLISEKSIGYYWHGLSLTLYFLYTFDNIECEFISKYRHIMNEIANIGGDTDTNCAIVGCVIGPLVGYTNFDSEFEICLKLVPKDRFMYSTAMMYYYVEYLENITNNKQFESNEIRFNYYQMLLTLLNTTIKI